MSSIATKKQIEVLTSRHRLEVLRATLRQVEHSPEFDPNDDAVLEMKHMFENQIDLELCSIYEPAD